MSLVAGTRLGPYEIQSAIGAGGMGEVYKARDTRLDRTVAIKVLPAELSADPERRTRFEREARAIAALNHPHICTLHDIGTHDGTTYLVMEHLPGQTLADRLLKGPLPLAQALDISAQIADALDAAHKHGIIHRDLKPGNVMLTTGGAGRSGVTTAKLLDFGLAKLAAHGERPAVAGGASVSTQAAPVTAEGTILGTLQYMAPEQLEGKEADARTDLWALGAILYEMLTGKRAFEGESQVSLIGNIMNAEPPALATTQPLTPPALDRVVTKCLAKHPDDRWDGAHDVADELRWIARVTSAGTVTGSVAGAQSRRARGLRLAAVSAGTLVIFAAGAGLMWLFRPRVPSLPVAHLSLDVRPAEELNAGGVAAGNVSTPGGSRTAFTWTPDGQALVFVGRRAGIQQIYVRRLDAAEARLLPNTEGAQVPAVSADGQWVAFWASGAIKKVPLGGGPAVDLASPVASPPANLVFDAGDCLFYDSGGRIWTVRPGVKPTAVTTVGEGGGFPTLPSLLPGGTVLLYTVRKRRMTWGNEELVAQALATGQRTSLPLPDAVDVRYVSSGDLVFLRRGTLFAVPFDAARLEMRGSPGAILDQVVQALTDLPGSNRTGAGQFAVSSTGTLAWVPGPLSAYGDAAILSVDRRGRVSPLNVPPRNYAAGIRLAPAGDRLAVSTGSLGGVSVWTLSLARGTLTPLVQEWEADGPIWTPDGQRVVFAWWKEGRWMLAWQRADGLTPAEILLPEASEAQPPGRPGPRTGYPAAWTPDGRDLVMPSGGDLLSITVENGRATVKWLTDTPYIETSPEFSPDGHWLAYGSNKTGQSEIYVTPYPALRPELQISVDGGICPAWNRNGRELFFVRPDAQAGTGQMMAAAFDPAFADRIGTPKPLFRFGPELSNFIWTFLRTYDVAPDGQHFYIVQFHPPPARPPVTHINLIQNWFEELKSKVPTTGHAK